MADVDRDAVLAEWSDEYPEGVDLFCAAFEAEDFDDLYGSPHPDGATVAVRRCVAPTPGFLARNRHVPEEEIGFVLLEKHASPRALDIINDLTTEAWTSFAESWQADGVGEAGKSNRSSRRAASKSRRSAAT